MNWFDDEQREWLLEDVLFMAIFMLLIRLALLFGVK